MKQLTIALMMLLLTSCGQQEKEEDPFGKATNPQRGTPPLTEREFKNTCNRRGGAIVDGGKLCMYTAHTRIYDKEKLDKEFGDTAGFVFIKIGKVALAATLWADRKGGQTVSFFVDGKHVADMTDEKLEARHIPHQGELTMRVLRGQYEYLNVVVAQCITQNGSNHHCPL
jgi:hypothetical protein